MTRKFKWVKISNKYGVKNWVSYELFIEGRSTRVALIERIKPTDRYHAIVRFDKDGYNGMLAGWDKKTGTGWTFAYLDDAKKAVERYYGLKRPAKKKVPSPFGL